MAKQLKQAEERDTDVQRRLSAVSAGALKRTNIFGQYVLHLMVQARAAYKRGWDGFHMCSRGRPRWEGFSESDLDRAGCAALFRVDLAARLQLAVKTPHPQLLRPLDL